MLAKFCSLSYAGDAAVPGCLRIDVPPDQISLAAERHLSRTLSILSEIVTTQGSGGFRGQSGSIAGIGGLPRAGSEPVASDTEATLGLAEHINRHFKLEEGGILKTDGSWQLVFGWEWDFGEGD